MKTGKKTKPISLYPLKIEDVIADVLKVKPERKPSKQARRETARPQMMNRKPSGRLNVKKILVDFQKTEESLSGRNGTFKIDAPFDAALDRILKAKPEVKPTKGR